ncbi:MAG: hypothetical protein LUE99_00540 [Bacteroides sp.]|nr:hypothetical protein [Bacteroides sp.]
MNRYEYKMMVCAVLALLVLGACMQNVSPVADIAPRTMAVDIQLTLPPALEPETRSVTDNNGITINNVWVIQYIPAATGGSSSKMIAQHYTDAAAITWDSDKHLFGVSTGNQDFINENSQFYVIVNADAADGSAHAGLTALQETSQLSELMACVKEITAGTTTDPQLLVANPSFEKKGQREAPVIR